MAACEQSAAREIPDTDRRTRGGISRVSALDGLRGLAALAVALGHCNLVVTGSEIWSRSIRDFPGMSYDAIAQRLAYVVFPSDAAVALFFVLSGHVLWESFVRNGAGWKDLPDYLVGRTYRLLPVAILSAVPLGFLADASASELVKNMLILGLVPNGVIWSLQVEVVCSVAMIVAWFIVGQSRTKFVLLLGAVLAMAPAFRGSNFFLFFPAFLLGASINYIPQEVWRRRRFFWVGLACLLLASLFLTHAAISRVFEIIGAMAVIGCTRTRPLAWLKSRPVLFLGAVSYPFYLSHETGLILAQSTGVLAYTSDPFLKMGLLAFISVPIALMMACVLHVGVELPAMRGRPRLIFHDWRRRT